MTSNKNKLQEYCQKNMLTMPLYECINIGEPHSQQWKCKVSIINNGQKIFAQTDIVSPSKKAAESYAASLLMNKVNIPQYLGDNKMTWHSVNKDKYLPSSPSPYPNKAQYLPSSPSPYQNKDKYLQSSTPLHKNGMSSNHYTVIYMIDLENRPFTKRETFDNNLYIGGLSCTHHTVDKYKDWYLCEDNNLRKRIKKSQNNKLLFTIEGGVRDLVDHFITMLTTAVIEYIKLRPDEMYSIIIVSADNAAWCTHNCLKLNLKWNGLLNNVKIINKQ